MPGIAVDGFLNLVERFVVVDADGSTLIQFSPKYMPYNFVHDEGLADVGAEVADAGNRPQLLAGLNRDAVHFRPRACSGSVSQCMRKSRSLNDRAAIRAQMRPPVATSWSFLRVGGARSDDSAGQDDDADRGSRQIAACG